jgi:hypothetical protein
MWFDRRTMSRKPLYVRDLSKTEKIKLEQGLQSASAFTVRRCQILLSSAQKKTATQISGELHCSDQSVRNAIHAFDADGLACLQPKSHARHDDQCPFDETGLKRLQEIIRMTPRAFGQDTSLWTLELLAETCWQEKISRRPVSVDGLRRALKSVGVQWRRAKKWIRSPDPHYQHRKKDEIS